MDVSEVIGPVKRGGIVAPVGPTGSPIEPPDYYIDGAKIQFSQVGIALLLLRSKPEFAERPGAQEAVAVLRMSPQMAAQLVSLIDRSLRTLAAQTEEAEEKATAGESKEAEQQA